jgi:hypothetical protein
VNGGVINKSAEGTIDETIAGHTMRLRLMGVNPASGHVAMRGLNNGCVFILRP